MSNLPSLVLSHIVTSGFGRTPARSLGLDEVFGAAAFRGSGLVFYSRL